MANGEVLIDSPGIIDVLHEIVGPEKALLPPPGASRLEALQLIGIGLAIYPKLTALFDETLRPENYRLQSAIEGFAEQAIIGLKLLEAAAGDGWYVTSRCRPGGDYRRGASKAGVAARRRSWRPLFHGAECWVSSVSSWPDCASSHQTDRRTDRFGLCGGCCIDHGPST